jgi:hypothetical protein
VAASADTPVTAVTDTADAALPDDHQQTRQPPWHPANPRMRPRITAPAVGETRKLEGPLNRLNNQPGRYPPRPGPAERRPLAVAAITTLEVFSSRRHQRREQKAPISIIRVRHHRPCRSAESGARSAGVCASPRRGPITRCERKHRVDEFAIACHPPMAAQNGPRSGVAAIINCAGAGSRGGRRVRAWLLPAVGRLL